MVNWKSSWRRAVSSFAVVSLAAAMLVGSRVSFSEQSYAADTDGKIEEVTDVSTKPIDQNRGVLEGTNLSFDVNEAFEHDDDGDGMVSISDLPDADEAIAAMEDGLERNDRLRYAQKQWDKGKRPQLAGPHTVSLPYVPGGQVVFEGEAEDVREKTFEEAGETISLRFIPEDGYQLSYVDVFTHMNHVNVQEDDLSQVRDGVLTFETVNASMDVNAMFTPEEPVSDGQVRASSSRERTTFGLEVDGKDVPLDEALDIPAGTKCRFYFGFSEEAYDESGYPISPYVPGAGDGSYLKWNLGEDPKYSRLGSSYDGTLRDGDWITYYYDFEMPKSGVDFQVLASEQWEYGDLFDEPSAYAGTSYFNNNGTLAVGNEYPGIASLADDPGAGSDGYEWFGVRDLDLAGGGMADWDVGIRFSNPDTISTYYPGYSGNGSKAPGTTNIGTLESGEKIHASGSGEMRTYQGLAHCLSPGKPTPFGNGSLHYTCIAMTDEGLDETGTRWGWAYFWAYVTPDSGEQDGGFYLKVRWRIPGVGIDIMKYDANPSVSALSDCYSLGGAVFGVYSDARCTRLITSCATDSTGHTYICAPSLSTGKNTYTYYIKEISPSPGYLLNNTVYSVRLHVGESMSSPIRVPEEPIYHDPDIRIYKKDATTGRPTATGAGTLGGAEFTIKYYDNVDGRTTGTPDRTWVVRTNETGVWNMNTMYNSHKVSGDPWFMSGNTPVLPAGTYTFQETKAPVGYVLNTQVFKEIVKADDYDATSITVFQDPEVPETPIRGGFKMQKFEVGGNAVGSGDITMAGAVYEIVNNTGKSVVVNGKEAANGAVCYTFTTGSTGAFTSASDLLPYGSYTIREKTPPAGMLLSGNKLSASFTITTNGQMADLTTGQLADPPMRGDVKITKENARISGDEGDASLSGITFTVYNRSARAIRKPDGTSVAPGGVVTTLTTSIVDGKAVAQTTGGMLSYGTYGIKETATNNSYQLTDGVEKRFRLTSHNQVVTLDASGNALVAKNVPILGGFEFQKYNKESGKAEAVGDATLGGGVYEIVNRSAHDVVVAGNRVAPGNVCFTFTTDANGHYKSAADLLPYGSYTIREKTAPLGFTLNGKLTEDFQIRSHGAFVDLTKGAIANELIRGDLELVKKDAQTEDGSSQGDAELEGIEFVVKNASGKSVMLPDGTVVAPNGEVARIVTKYEDGRAIAKTEGRLLPYGTYTVQEVATNDSYLLTDGQPKTFQIRTDSEVVRADVNGSEIVFKNQVVRGGIQGGKLSFDNDDSYDGALGDATLGGARLAIRNRSNHPVVVNGQSYGTGEECLYVTTDADGHWATETDALPYGTYEIREKDAPVGYQINPDWVVSFQIREDGEMIEVPKDDNLFDEPTHGGASFGKNDIEFGLSEALGGRDHGANSEGSHLDGIVFRIFNASKNPVFNSEGELCMPGDPVLDIVTEWREDLGRYAAVTTDIALSYGTYKVQEYAQDRDGSYQIVDKEPRTFQIREKNVDTVVVDGMECTTYSSGAMTMEDVDGEEMVFENQVTRGDFSFTKVAGGQAKRLSVPFKLTNVATGESHLIVTDKNGMFSSETAWVKHSQDTNANDAYLEHGASVEDAISMSDLNMRSGVWFGKGEAGSMSEANDELGALPYGEYLLEELHSDTNAGYEMQTFTFYVYNHGATVDGGTITDNPDAQPEIHTAAVDPATGLQEVLADESTTIVDNVSYVNLKHGEEYEIRGILMDKETGRPINIDGKRVESTVKFRAAGTQGTVKVEYTFNALSLKGKTLVVFEDLYKDGKKILSHSDIDDADQTITFPEVQTHATDEDGEQDTGAYEEVTITDRVSYSNLVPGKRYVMKGKLMVKEKRPDGSIKEKPLLDADGNPVEEEVEFVPETPDGTVDVVFVFDGSLLAGKTIVAFEELQQSGVTIGVHMDIEDADQTLVFPKIGTQAREQESGSDEALAGEETSIIDKVSYDGLLPGREYTLSGTLMDKQTKKPVVSNGKEVTASTKFTASASGTGFVELTFTFDASDLGGHTTVVFEELYRDGRKLAWHTDIQDDGQTITFPDVHTTAMDTATGGHGTEADETDRITDRVFYTNLVPGREYSMTGTLMKKSDGTPLLVDGQPVTKTVIFVPEAPNGYVDLVFDVDTSLLAGDTIVAFEELKRDGFTVGVHMDLEDEDQSVHVHQIGTQAWDQETQMQTIAKGDSVHIIDRVRYIGLEAGKEYALRCVVMDRDTGKAFKNADREFVTGTLEFVAEDTSGAIRGDVSTWGYADVELVLDSTELAGRSLVLFEYLVEPSDDYGEGVPDGTKLAKHTDLSDEGQTLYVPEIGTQAKSLDGSDLVAAIADAGIVDTVAYKNLVPGQSYRVSGVLMDRSTGKPLVIPGMEGNVTAETVFVPETPDGEVAVEFSFDASGLKGLDVVVFEELYVDHTLVADHKDIGDEGQTVKVPGIGTQALSGEGHKVVGSYPKETIVDTVKYEGLVPGLEYELVGVLYDQVTGQTVTYLDETGVETPAESSVRFTPSESDGYVEVVFSLDASRLKGHSLVVLEELFLQGKPVADHKDTEDEGQTVYVPQIHTEALGVDGTHVVEKGKKAIVTDRVEYKNLVPGLEYVMSGVLVDKETGKPVLDHREEDCTASVKFTPETPDGFVEITFEVDTRDLAGKTLVAFEELSLKGTVVTDHKDKDDEGQTVYVPKIGTKALSENGGKVLTYGTNAKFVDVVSYQNLVPGVEYTLTGWLMDKETGEEIMVPDYDSPDVLPDGSATTDHKKRLEASMTFVPEGRDGEVSMEFSLDTTALAGKEIVVFEELSIKGSLVADHKDLEDEGQTLRIPSMGTEALSEEGRKMVAWGVDAVVIDKVRFTGLTPGQEYEVSGYLVDGRTGEPVLPGGEPVSATALFTPESSDGYVEMRFEFDSRKLAGLQLVAFEEITLNGELIADHKDVNDEGQTVYVSKLGTTAGNNWGDKVVRENGQAVVIDTVHYENLIPDITYRLEGVLMDQKTGEPVMQPQVDGPEAPVSASMEFTPETSSGDVDLKFTLDATLLDGHTLVVFESLYIRSTLVGEHKDINDEGQTVYVPEIGTQAHNGNGVKEIAAGESTVVVDTVSYRNLVPGLTYTVHGKLMDRVTKLPVAEGSVEFVPETSEGTVDMEFVVDTRALEGHALVAFEYLEIRDVPVASHEDLEDEGQTVYVPKIGTKASGAAVKTVELGKKTVVKDVVEYAGLEVGKEHVMRGRLLDKQTGEIVANAEVSFVPESSDGSVELFFELDTRKLTGHTFVALEELLLDGDVTGRHENPDDEDQTVYVAKIGTKAYGEDGSKVLSRGRKTLVYDDVMYENLVPGQEYLLKGVLVDQETEEAVASAEHSFVCGKPDGSVTLTFTVDTRALAGRKLVAFEELYGFGENGEEVFVGKHKDLEDLAQTVSIPEIGTTACGEDGKKEIAAADEAVVVDTVEYHGLVPEEVYVLEGVLMDQATGKPVVSHGLEVTASKQFVPEESDGFVDVLFGFDASALAGRNLVVFERLYMEGGKEFARHEDLEDEGQTVTVVETPEPEGPWIGTRADNGAGSKNLAAGPEAVVVDVVSYKNLTPGQTYRLEGVLMEKGTGAPVVNGSEETPVASAVEFTPESADGEVEVRFVFDASEYAGADLVVFEKLYLEDEVIATHEDIEDEEQTVYVELPPDAPTDVRIGTKASGRDGNKLLPISEKVEIVDVVSYTGLEVGTTYRLDGELMDQESNDSIGIYGETTFTPDSPDGEIEVVFTLDTRAYAGKSLVVFERLYSENTGRRIATHEDIEDEGQTVTVDTPDVPDTPDTGLRNLAKAFGVLALISICLGMAVFGVFVWRKRR